MKASQTVVGLLYPKLITRAEREARRMRGLGDVVAAMTKAVGVKPCAPCKKRQEILNNLVPFRKVDQSPK